MTENQKLREACNYIDALGGDSRSYRQALALPTATPVGEREEFEQFAQNCPMGKYNVTRRGEGYDSSHTQIMWDAWRARAALSTDDHEQSKPSVEFDLGETSSHTVKCVWSEWDAKANKLVLCLSVRDIETAAPVGERDLPQLPDPTYIYHDAEQGEDDLFEFSESGAVDEGCPKCKRLYTADQMRAYARSALSAGDAGWQPIDTAPKDGSDCWLLVEEEVRRGFWVEIEFEERRDLDGRYIDQTDDDAYWMDKDSGDSLEPTMFYPITKPLPPAPAMRKGQL